MGSRAFTLAEVVVALGVLALAGLAVIGLWVRSAEVEFGSSQMKGAAEILRFFADRALYGDSRFLPAAGQQKSFDYGQLSEALRSVGVNLARSDQYRVQVTAQSTSSTPSKVVYTVQVCYKTLRGEECRSGNVWGSGVVP